MPWLQSNFSLVHIRLIIVSLGVEVHEYNLLREWSDTIDKNEEKHKVVKWNDQIVQDNTETCHEINNGAQEVETDDEDYQFYARTIGKQSLIVENIGAALRRSNSTCQQIDYNIDACITANGEKKCTTCGPCRCPACKQRVIRAAPYLELELSKRGGFYEI